MPLLVESSPMTGTPVIPLTRRERIRWWHVEAKQHARQLGHRRLPLRLTQWQTKQAVVLGFIRCEMCQLPGAIDSTAEVPFLGPLFSFPCQVSMAREKALL